jgi:hypothetical protein
MEENSYKLIYLLGGGHSGSTLLDIIIGSSKKVLISKKRYIVEKYLGLSHLNGVAHLARLTKMVKNTWDAMCR